MSAYALTVFQAVPTHRDPRVALVAHVLRVECEPALAWVKQHADEIARRQFPGASYVALMVEPYPGINGATIEAFA